MDELELEKRPDGEAGDETDVSLRAYFTRVPAEKLRQYNSAWTDDQLIAWDGNFRSDGSLMLVCCERDVDVGEYRAVLEEHLLRRGLV